MNGYVVESALSRVSSVLQPVACDEVLRPALLAVREQARNADIYGRGPVIHTFTIEDGLIVSEMSYPSRFFDWREWMDGRPDIYAGHWGIWVMRQLGDVRYRYEGGVLTAAWAREASTR